MPQPSRSHGRRFAQDEMPADMQNDWLQRLARFNMRFGRFVRDAIGVLLIAFALMSFFALLGYCWKKNIHFVISHYLFKLIFSHFAFSFPIRKHRHYEATYSFHKHIQNRCFHLSCFSKFFSIQMQLRLFEELSLKLQRSLQHRC